MKISSKRIGILGGSFDPPHNGHIKISLISLKKLKLNKIYWIITKKNPDKRKPFFSLKKRIVLCKKITKSFKKISVYKNKKIINSSRSIKVINFLRNYYFADNIYLIIGSDNLINFNKWSKWKKIIKNCKLVVLSRTGYDKKAKKAYNFRLGKNKNIIFINNKKIDISSTSIKKKYR